MCLNGERDDTGHLVILHMHLLGALGQFGEGIRNGAGQVTAIELDAGCGTGSKGFELAQGCGQVAGNARVGVQHDGLEDRHVPDVRQCATQVGLEGHELQQSFALAQFGRDFSADAGLGNVDAGEFLQASDFLGNAAGHICVAVHVQLGQLRELSQFRGQRAGQVVILEIKLFQLGQAKDRFGNLAGQFVAADAEIGKFREVADFGRERPFRRDGDLGRQLQDSNAAAGERDTRPGAHVLGQIPVAFGPFGALGGVVDGDERQRVGVAAQGSELLGDGQFLGGPVDRFLDGKLGGAAFPLHVLEDGDLHGCASGSFHRFSGDPVDAFRNGEGPRGVGGDVQCNLAALSGNVGGGRVDEQRRRE